VAEERQSRGQQEDRGGRRDDRDSRPSGGDRGGPRRRRFGGGGGNRYFPRRKVCYFCMDGISVVDYKDIGRLRRYVSDRGKIEPRRQTGTCAKHQRMLSRAVKRARHVALIPFSQ
jgi:small subunit ribosomal protein S18